MEFARAYSKAIAAALVTSAAYLIGVIPAEGGFADVSTVQWLGLMVALGGGFGVTAAAPANTPRSRNRQPVPR